MIKVFRDHLSDADSDYLEVVMACKPSDMWDWESIMETAVDEYKKYIGTKEEISSEYSVKLTYMYKVAAAKEYLSRTGVPDELLNF